MVRSTNVSARMPLNRRERLALLFLASLLLAGVAMLTALLAYSAPRRYADIGALAVFPPREAPYQVYADDLPIL